MQLSGSLDTNAIVRLLLNDIPQQRNAVKALLTQATGQLAVADTAIMELVFVLERYYEFSRQQIEEAVIGLMQLKEINCNRRLFEKTLPIYVNHTALSFEDCCLSTYAVLNSAEPLWTFDKKLATQVASAKLIAI